MSVPLLVGFIVYMLSYMPAANTSLVVKIDVGLAWYAHHLSSDWTPYFKDAHRIKQHKQAKSVLSRRLPLSCQPHALLLIPHAAPCSAAEHDLHALCFICT